MNTCSLTCPSSSGLSSLLSFRLALQHLIFLNVFILCFSFLFFLSPHVFPSFLLLFSFFVFSSWDVYLRSFTLSIYCFLFSKLFFYFNFTFLNSVLYFSTLVSLFLILFQYFSAIKFRFFFNWFCFFLLFVFLFFILTYFLQVCFFVIYSISF